TRKRYRPDPDFNVDNVTPDQLRILLRNHYNSSNDQLNAFVYVIEERQKEFMHEGMRWFDIKRLQIPVVHVMQDGGVDTLEPDDNRKVLQIPQSAIDVGGLEPNPR